MITPFINLAGQADEAITFYESVFDGQDKKILRYKDIPDNPEYPVPEEQKKYILHAEMTICGTRVSFSDTQQEVLRGNIISLAAEFPSESEVATAFNRLKESGEVLMEPAPQFFSPMYGWVVDKFGVGWQLICMKPEVTR